MSRSSLAGVLVLGLAASASAGEIVFTNGDRVAGELATQVLLVSTGSDVVEVAPTDVAELTPSELRLKDGRVVRGTLVGGRLRMRTELGELAIDLDRLRTFRAEPAPPPPTPAEVVAPSPPPAPVAAPPAAEVKGPRQVAQGARSIGRGFEDTARGVGATVVEGADRVHDGFKAVGLTIWEGMKAVGRAVRTAFDP